MSGCDLSVRTAGQHPPYIRLRCEAAHSAAGNAISVVTVAAVFERVRSSAVAMRPREERLVNVRPVVAVHAKLTHAATSAAMAIRRMLFQTSLRLKTCYDPTPLPC